jgi:hypothetical protein
MLDIVVFINVLIFGAWLLCIEILDNSLFENLARNYELNN